MNILLLYGFHKSGHFSVCTALKEEIESFDYNAEIKSFWNNDSITITKLFSIFRKCVELKLDYFPHFLIDKDLLEVMAKEIKPQIKFEDYDLVISTHAYTSYVTAEIFKQRNIKIPLVDVHTDFTSFPIVEHENITNHVGTFPKFINKIETVKKSIKSFIPINERYYCADFNNKINKIVVMGGADGFGLIEETLDWANSIFNNFEIDVMCGRNEKLYQNLKNRQFREGINIFAFTDEIQNHLKNAKFILTKASGSTLAEAMVMNVIPIFMPTYLPWELEAGKELAYLKIGIPVQSYSKQEADYVSDIITNNSLIEILLSNQKKIIRKSVFDDILKNLKNANAIIRNQSDYSKLCTEISVSLNADYPILDRTINTKIKEWIGRQ